MYYIKNNSEYRFCVDTFNFTEDAKESIKIAKERGWFNMLINMVEDLPIISDEPITDIFIDNFVAYEALYRIEEFMEDCE